MADNVDLSVWLEYISQKHAQKMDLGLARVLLVAKRMSLLYTDVPIIHVAGTNGKGTCVHALEAIYQQAGYRVGKLTSPHLHKINERICVNGEPVSDDLLVEAIQEVDAHCQETLLTYFEYLTLAALWLFKSSDVDLMVLEVGLGGRLDATNLVHSTVGIITSIGKDHQDWLGDTYEAIAWEKAGIVKEGMLGLVMADVRASDVIVARCRDQHVPLFRLDRDFFIETNELGWVFSAKSLFWHLSNTPYLRSNLACACQAVLLLQSMLPVTEAQVCQALASLFVPGRLQQCHIPQTVLLDVAHNEDSAKVLADALEVSKEGHRRVAVVAMLQSKDSRASLLPLLPLVDEWWLPSLSEADMKSPEAMGNILHEMGVQNHRCFASMDEVLEAITNSDDDTLHTVIFGSFHTVSAFEKSLLAKDRERIK